LALFQCIPQKCICLAIHEFEALGNGVDLKVKLHQLITDEPPNG
jgi:hypothetical protein